MPINGHALHSTTGSTGKIADCQRVRQGMLERTGPNRGELAKAHLTLQQAETKLERIVALLGERRAERHDLETHIQEAAATGDMDKLVDLQNRAGVVEKTIAELR